MAISAGQRASWTYGTALSPNDKRTLWTPRLKHCHIHPARQRSIRLSLPQLALRNISPLNHFLFPTPRAFEMSHGTAPDQVTTDLGESQVVIDWVRHRLAMHLADCAALLDEYLAAIGAQRKRSLKDETVRIRRLSQHASVLQPNEEDRRGVVRDRVGASGRAASNWTLNAAHGYYVRTGLRASVVDVALSFKALNGQITPIGVFSLDLQALARAGAVKVRQVDGHDVFDVRIIRDEDGVYWLAGQDRIRQPLR
jgi:hypothetical protein